MGRLVAGTIAGAIAAYVWGFLYWGVDPLPYTSWKSAASDEAAGKALLEHFPQNGTYYVPSLQLPPDRLNELMERGPVAFVHMLRVDGRPVMDPSAMIKGFVLYLVAAAVLALLVRPLAQSLDTASNRLTFSVLLALVAALLIDIGDHVWWYIPLQWKLYQAFYDFTALLIMGFTVSTIVLRRDAGPVS